MKIKSIITVAAVSALAAFDGTASAADADGATVAQPAKWEPRVVTRAEVLADLVIHRESGLAAADLPENFGMEMAGKAKAQAKYAELRKSAHYAELVRRYGGDERTMATVANAR